MKMCCGTEDKSRLHHIGSGCCCHPRRFLTKEEQLKRLEEYAKTLEKELTGLKEYIEEFKKKS